VFFKMCNLLIAVAVKLCVVHHCTKLCDDHSSHCQEIAMCAFTGIFSATVMYIQKVETVRNGQLHEAHKCHRAKNDTQSLRILIHQRTQCRATDDVRSKQCLSRQYNVCSRCVK